MEFVIFLLFILVFGVIIYMLYMRKKINELIKTTDLINHKYNRLNEELRVLITELESLEKEV